MLFRLSATGVERVPRTGPAVIVSNHVSWLDPLIILLILPRKPGILAMEELWQIRWLRFVFRMYGRSLVIPLRRDTVDATAVKRALQVLQSGAALMVFPEGGISLDGRLQPFHRGAALLAARSRAPLVPAAIIGTRDALPLNEVIPRLRPISVRVGTPIAPPGPGRKELTRATAEAVARIQSLLDA